MVSKATPAARASRKRAARSRTTHRANQASKLAGSRLPAPSSAARSEAGGRGPSCTSWTSSDPSASPAAARQ